VSGDDADTNAHTFCIEGDGSAARLLRDTTKILSHSSGFTNLTGFTLAARGDGTVDDSSVNPINLKFLEYTILENHTQSERDSEIDRQMSTYNI